MLLDNVIEELQDKVAHIACDAACSKLLQQVLLHAQYRQLLLIAKGIAGEDRLFKVSSKYVATSLPAGCGMLFSEATACRLSKSNHLVASPRLAAMLPNLRAVVRISSDLGR